MIEKIFQNREYGCEMLKNDSGLTAIYLASSKTNSSNIPTLLENRNRDFKEIFSKEKHEQKTVVDTVLNLEYGSDILSQALVFASTFGHINSVDLFLEKGAPIDSKDENGQTSLSGAAENGHHNMIEFLLEHGANIDATDNQGLTPICTAAEKGHQDIIETLLRRKSRIDFQTVANILGHKNIKKEVFDLALNESVLQRQEEAVKLLLDKADVTTLDNVALTTVLEGDSVTN